MRAILLAILAGVGCGHPAPVPTPQVLERVEPAMKETNPMAASGFPLPPHQHDAWTSKAQVPAPLIDAATVLFAQGLADPRKLPYVEIELATGSVWSGTGDNVKTRGWLLPAHRDAATWAIAWNGLVYPVVAAGAAADLRADMTALIAKERAARMQYEAENPGWTYHRFQTTGEPYGVSHETVTATKVLLLLRLGEDQLAADLWKEFDGGELNQVKDPLLAVAGEWMWSLFDRGVTAHMRGDDRLANASAKPLVAIASALRAEAERRKLTDAASYFDFLAPLDALAEDAARRARQPHREPLDAKELASLTPDERVKVLIERLEDVAARQWGQPGGVDLASDPIVEALIAEGAIAVEPLIEVVERDTRLTRSVHFHRDFSRHRSLLGVHEAAYVALAGILETSFFEAVATGDDLSGRGMAGRKKVADAVRAYWAQWKAVPLEERWYRTLADDAAKPEDWADAAAKITRPGNVRVHPSSMVFVTTTTGSGGSTALRGEPLRTHSGSSVGQLLEKRTRATPLEFACGMALAYGRWDAAAAAATLREQTARAIAGSANTPGNKKWGRCIAALVEARTAANDLRALDEYAAWIKTTTPDGDSWDSKTMFEPMLRNPAHKAIAAASDAMFRDGSPWLPIVETRSSVPNSYLRVELAETELIRTSGMNKQVVKALADKRIAGKLVRKSDTNASIDMVAGWGTGTDPSKDPLAPPVGTTIDIRVCDYLAWIVSRRQGAPKLELYWPLADRDRALVEMTAFVTALRVK